jgi:hypothetical protein
MPLVQLHFPNPLNTSVQIGDIAYFTNPWDVGGPHPVTGADPTAWASTMTPHKTSEQQDIIKIGEIIAIVPWTGSISIITCDMDSILYNAHFAKISVTDPKSFIMFSKDNKVNLSSAAGYYASVTFKNDSKDKAELFNVGTDMFESSK